MTADRDARADDGFVALTGAGGSVAPAVAEAFLERGDRLALFDRAGKEDRVMARLPRFATDAAAGRLAVFGADLASEDDTARAIGEAAERLGACRALINLAGGFAAAPAAEAGLRDLERMLDVNLRSAVNATRAVLPGMLARGSGFVLAVGAGAGLTPAPGKTAYAAAKAALAAYFGSLAAEVGQRGVNVAVLHPLGTIDTPANRLAMPTADPSTWITPEAVADAVLYLADRPARGRVHELRLQAT